MNMNRVWRHRMVEKKIYLWPFKRGQLRCQQQAQGLCHLRRRRCRRQNRRTVCRHLRTMFHRLLSEAGKALFRWRSLLSLFGRHQSAVSVSIRRCSLRRLLPSRSPCRNRASTGLSSARRATVGSAGWSRTRSGARRSSIVLCTATLATLRRKKLRRGLLTRRRAIAAVSAPC